MPRQRALRRAQQRAAARAADTAAVNAAMTSLYSLAVSEPAALTSVACFNDTSLAFTAACIFQFGRLPAARQTVDWTKLPVLLLVRVLSYCRVTEILNAGLVCLDWSDALRVGDVWTYATGCPVPAVMLAEVLKRCQPVVVDLSCNMLQDAALMRQLLHTTNLQRLKCSLEVLQMLMTMQQSTTYPALQGLQHLSIGDDNAYGVKTEAGWQCSKDHFTKHMNDIAAAFKSLQTIELTNVAVEAASFLLLVGKALSLPNRAEQRVEAINLPASSHEHGEPPAAVAAYNITFEVHRDHSDHIAVTLLRYDSLFNVQWPTGTPKPSKDAFESLAKLGQTQALLTAEHTVYVAQIQNEDVEDFLMIVLRQPCEFLTVQLDLSKTWSWSHQCAIEMHVTAASNLTLTNAAARQVVVADSLLQLLAVSSSLRSVSLCNVTTSHAALRFFASTRQALELPFCAISLYNCIISQPNTSDLARLVIGPADPTAISWDELIVRLGKHKEHAKVLRYHQMRPQEAQRQKQQPIFNHRLTLLKFD